MASLIDTCAVWEGESTGRRFVFIVLLRVSGLCIDHVEGPLCATILGYVRSFRPKTDLRLHHGTEPSLPLSHTHHEIPTESTHDSIEHVLL